jgi:hypothetical protein
VNERRAIFDMTAFSMTIYLEMLESQNFKN